MLRNLFLRHLKLFGHFLSKLVRQKKDFWLHYDYWVRHLLDYSFDDKNANVQIISSGRGNLKFHYIKYCRNDQIHANIEQSTWHKNRREAIAAKYEEQNSTKLLARHARHVFSFFLVISA